MTQLRFILAMVALFGLFLAAGQDDAHAQSTISDGAGSVGACGLIYEADCELSSFDVSAEGGRSLNPNSGLKVTARIFSATVCQIETIVYEVFSAMWCTIAEEIKEPLSAFIALYIVIFGIMFTSGMVNLTAKEAISRVIKVGLVWLFATNAQFGITIMFQLYMFVLQDGIAIVLGLGNEYSSVQSIMTRLDVVAGQIFATNQYNTEGRVLTAIAGALMMGASFPGGPMVGYAMFSMAIMTFLVFARTVLTYLIAIVGITFYLSLGPIFISLALFKTTNTMFERWLGQVTSFALQPVIIFAYLMMAEAYIENVIDEFPSMTELMESVAVMEDNSFKGATMSVTDIFVFLQPGCDPGEVGENPDCEYIDPDSTWGEGTGDLMGVFAGMTAVLILNFATVKFLDLVPEIARQISSGAARAIKIGGGGNAAGFSPSGASLYAPTDGLVESMYKGAENSQSGDYGERMRAGLLAGEQHLADDAQHRMDMDRNAR